MTWLADLVSSLQKMECLPKLLKLIIAFHEDVQRNIQQNAASSSHSQSSVESSKAAFSPNTIWPLHSLLLSYAFQGTEDGIYLHTISDGGLFNLVPLRSKTKTCTVIIREMLFADDAALAALSEQALQGLVDRLSQVCDNWT